MANFQPNGASAVPKGGAVIGFNDSSTLFDSTKPENASNLSTNVKKQEFIGTKEYATGGTVDGVVIGPQGQAAFELTPQVVGGNVVYVTAGSDIVGGYYITDTSGIYSLSNKPFRACYADESGGTYVLCSGALDTSVFTTIFDNCNHGQLPDDNSEFRSYTSRVYTDVCFATFCGDLDPCDVSGSTITLWNDRRNEFAVTYSNGIKVNTNSGLPGAGGSQS